MRSVLLILGVLCGGCTLTIGHPPESARVIREEVRAEYQKLMADDLARALSEVAKIPQLNESSNRVLLRNGYKSVKSIARPIPAPTPSKKENEKP